MFSGISISYDWIGSDGSVITPGRLSFSKSGKISYANAAGSKGTVWSDGSSLAWVNTHTGKNYKVTMRRSK